MATAENDYSPAYYGFASEHALGERHYLNRCVKNVPSVLDVCRSSSTSLHDDGYFNDFTCEENNGGRDASSCASLMASLDSPELHHHSCQLPTAAALRTASIGLPATSLRPVPNSWASAQLPRLAISDPALCVGWDVCGNRIDSSPLDKRADWCTTRPASPLLGAYMPDGSLAPFPPAPASYEEGNDGRGTHKEPFGANNTATERYGGHLSVDNGFIISAPRLRHDPLPVPNSCIPLSSNHSCSQGDSSCCTSGCTTEAAGGQGGDNAPLLDSFRAGSSSSSSNAGSSSLRSGSAASSSGRTCRDTAQSRVSASGSGGGGGAGASAAPPAPSRHLWLGNLLPTATRLDIEALFGFFGIVESARVFPSAPCSYAFVNYTTVQGAVAAKAALEGRRVPSLTGWKPLLVRFQQPTTQQHPGRQSRQDALSGLGPSSSPALLPEDHQTHLLVRPLAEPCLAGGYNNLVSHRGGGSQGYGVPDAGANDPSIRAAAAAAVAVAAAQFAGLHADAAGSSLLQLGGLGGTNTECAAAAATHAAITAINANNGQGGDITSLLLSSLMALGLDTAPPGPSGPSAAVGWRVIDPCSTEPAAPQGGSKRSSSSTSLACAAGGGGALDPAAGFPAAAAVPGTATTLDTGCNAEGSAGPGTGGGSSSSCCCCSGPQPLASSGSFTVPTPSSGAALVSSSCGGSASGNDSVDHLQALQAPQTVVRRSSTASSSSGAAGIGIGCVEVGTSGASGCAATSSVQGPREDLFAPQGGQREGPQQQQGQRRRDVVSRHLWLGNIMSTAEEQTLALAFSIFGPLESVRMFPDKNIAFVNYLSPQHAAAARAALHGRPVPYLTGCRVMDVRFQQRRPQQAQQQQQQQYQQQQVLASQQALPSALPSCTGLLLPPPPASLHARAPGTQQTGSSACWPPAASALPHTPTLPPSGAMPSLPGGGLTADVLMLAQAGFLLPPRSAAAAVAATTGAMAAAGPAMPAAPPVVPAMEDSQLQELLRLQQQLQTAAFLGSAEAAAAAGGASGNADWAYPQPSGVPRSAQGMLPPGPLGGLGLSADALAAAGALLGPVFGFGGRNGNGL